MGDEREFISLGGAVLTTAASLGISVERAAKMILKALQNGELHAIGVRATPEEKEAFARKWGKGGTA